MPAEVVERWLARGKPADINGKLLRPVEHSGLSGTPLSIQKGQAEAFCLTGANGDRWILKKFHNGRILDRSYLEAISTILPQHNGFISGTRREILSTGSLIRTANCYHNRELSQWLDGTILMSQIDGLDWSSLADDLRDGILTLDKAQRLASCRSLSKLVLLLEQIQAAHRDLSSGNVFIHPQDCSVSLIDFDSFYHPSLTMPGATTCGTVGYAAPYAWQTGVLDPTATWRPLADRYSLALLNVEFLVLAKGAPLSAEGGIFDQDELKARSGQSIELARRSLSTDFPEALGLFEAAINSSDFDQCPSPSDWLGVCDDSQVQPPSLAEMPEAEANYFEEILRKQRPAVPLWPAPKLSDLPSLNFQMAASARTTPVSVVTLPQDPWEDRT